MEHGSFLDARELKFDKCINQNYTTEKKKGSKFMCRFAVPDKQVAIFTMGRIEGCRIVLYVQVIWMKILHTDTVHAFLLFFFAWFEEATFLICMN